MKKIVWLNKSNGQLCVTIPKGSGIKEGDIISIEKEKIKTIVYTPVRGDMFHYGHLQLLQKANELGDFHICGVLTDDVIRSFYAEPISGLKERKSIISDLRCVDMVMVQNKISPTENIKIIREQFPNAKIILVYGSNWKKVPGADYIRKIKGKIIQPQFYEKLSTENIVRKIIKLYGKDKKNTITLKDRR